MDKRIVAIVGMAGSGKSELTKLFVANNYAKIRFGDLTEDELKKRGLPQNPKTEEFVREDIRKKYGMAAYALLNIPKINEKIKSRNIVIDGLYSWEELKVLRNSYKEKFFVVALFASPKVRYDRLEKRDVRPLSKSESMERDYAEIENINKGGPIAMADYTIINEGNLMDLRSEFNKLLAKIK